MRRLFLFLPLFSVIVYAQSIDPKSKIGYESINAADLRAHLTILASDSLEGRETSYPGQKKAANYIADIFKNLNLKAIGDNGTYFQHFDVEVSRVDPETKIITDVDGVKKNFTWGTDFISEGAKDTLVSGPAVFVGFTDTELDSSAKAKLAGRIVFVFIGKKNFASDTSKSATMRRFYAIRRDAGAAATLMIPDIEGPATFQKALETMGDFGTDKGTMKMKDSSSQLRQQFIRFLVSPELAETVLKPSGKSLKQLKNEALLDQPFPPVFIDDATVTITSKAIHETKQTENVLGFLPGSDPVLKSQVVIFTAHYDHLGISRTGVLYPGADDDGSGTVTILELAKAFTANPRKPKQSLLFMTVVGEEKGLYGSKYYTNNPIIPLDKTTVDLNLDMVGRIDTTHEANKDTNYTYVIGSNKISLELDSLLRIANNESEHLALDYTFNSENDPERFYYRSDHYNFAKNGVPIVFFFDGIIRDLHKPTDTVDKILFERMAKIGRLIYDLGWRLANLDLPLTKIPMQQ
ncbi:MAG: M28 family peptidase [Ignavibacteriales bacterium]|nr:M28 family peptidase [Ignavibacteriales bacterium]